MKKKLSISVADIMRRTSLSHTGNPINKNQNQPILINKTLRFEDLYKKAIGNKNYHHKIINHGLGHSSICHRQSSNKNTPTNTHRLKKNKQTNSLNYTKKSQINSQVSSLASSAKKVIPPSVPSHRLIQHCKENFNENYLEKNTIKQKQMNTRTPQKLITKNDKSQQKETKLNKQSTRNSFEARFQNCLKNLNHETHCHLRDRNECFLSQNEVDQILLELGYNIECEKHSDFLNLLEVDIYGGAPSQNLKQFLSLLQTKSDPIPKTSILKKSLPKIITNNLKLSITDQQKSYLKTYFQNYKPSQLDQKQNQSNFLNKLFTNYNYYQNSFKQNTQQKYYQDTSQTQQYCNYSSSHKKINNSVITQLIQNITHSDKQKCCKKQICKQYIIDTKIQQKIQIPSTILQKPEIYKSQEKQKNDQNSLKQPPKAQKTPLKQQQNIQQLKNRLNHSTLPPVKPPSPPSISQSRQLPQYFPSPKHPLKPILSIDVNLGQGLSQKIIVFQGQSAQQVAQRLSTKYTITDQIKFKFEKILETHLSNILWKIDQLSEEMLTDRTDSQI